MKVSNNDDAVTATSDWMWMTLMRLNRKAEAAKVLERITPKMDILENGSYHRRLLMSNGLDKPEALLDPANAEGPRSVREGHVRRRMERVRVHRGRGRFAADEIGSSRTFLTEVPHEGSS